MTIFVAEPAKRGNRMLKPQAVHQSCQSDERSLNFLVNDHPDCIYFTDAEAEFLGVAEGENTSMDLLNLALDHALQNDVITDSEADHLQQIFLRGCSA